MYDISGLLLLLFILYLTGIVMNRFILSTFTISCYLNVKVFNLCDFLNAALVY